MDVHYIYKITLLKGSLAGYYYVGKKSSTVQKYIEGGKLEVKDYIRQHPDFDSYCGSGVIVQSYFKHYPKILNETYQKEIITFTNSLLENLDFEETEVAKVYKIDPLCLNRCKGGLHNPATLGIRSTPYSMTEEQRKQSSEFHKRLWKDENYRNKVTNAIKAFHETHIGYNTRSQSEETKEKLSKKIKGTSNIKNSGTNNGMSGHIPANARCVLQYDLEGNFIKEWPSAAEAKRQLGIDNITVVCSGKRKTAGGFIWKYGTNNYSSETKSVAQYSLDGKLIATYKSAWEAGKKLNLDPSSIYKVCTGKANSCGRYIWKFNNNN